MTGGSAEGMKLRAATGWGELGARLARKRTSVRGRAPAYRRYKCWSAQHGLERSQWPQRRAQEKQAAGGLSVAEMIGGIVGAKA
jgi:hypothetical protein